MSPYRRRFEQRFRLLFFDLAAFKSRTNSAIYSLRHPFSVTHRPLPPSPPTHVSSLLPIVGHCARPLKHADSGHWPPPHLHQRGRALCRFAAVCNYKTCQAAPLASATNRHRHRASALTAVDERRRRCNARVTLAPIPCHVRVFWRSCSSCRRRRQQLRRSVRRSSICHHRTAGTNPRRAPLRFGLQHIYRYIQTRTSSTHGIDLHGTHRRASARLITDGVCSGAIQTTASRDANRRVARQAKNSLEGVRFDGRRRTCPRNIRIFVFARVARRSASFPLHVCHWRL